MERYRTDMKVNIKLVIQEELNRQNLIIDV